MSGRTSSLRWGGSPLVCALLFAANIYADDIAGIGARLRKDELGFSIDRVVSNSPAASNHAIHPGDRLLAVGQGDAIPKEVYALSMEQAVALIRGRTGTVVRLTIVPKGKDEREAQVVTFVRGEIKGLSDWGDGMLLANGVEAPNIPMCRVADGGREQLRDFRDKVIVLEFWSTGCAPCQISMAELQTYPVQYPRWRREVVLIAVNLDDTREQAAVHLRRKGWGKTHNVWVAKEAVKAYHVSGIPTVYVLDQKGIIAGSGSATSIPETVNRLLDARPSDR